MGGKAGFQLGGRQRPGRDALPGGDELPGAARRPGRLAPQYLRKRSAGKGGGGNQNPKQPKPKHHHQSRRAAPEGSSPVIAGAERGPVRYGRRYRGAAGGGGPGEAPLRLRQTASVSGRGNPRRKDPARPGKLKVGAFPQPRRFPVPPGSPLFSCLGAGGGGGNRYFSGNFTGPARPGATAAYLPLPERPGQRGRGFHRHGGGLGPPSPAGKGGGGTAAELRGTLSRLVEDGRFLGASPPAFTGDLGTRGRSAPSLSVGHPRHQAFPTPK